MEYAIYIDSLKEKREKLDSILVKNKRISRIYFGEEFCEELIPELVEIEESVEYVSRRKLTYTYVCGYLTDSGYNRQVKILKYLNARKVNNKKVEVIINDWGILFLISQRFKNLIPILGRMIFKNSRMPRYTIRPPIPYTELVVNPKVWQNQLRILRNSNLSVLKYRNFLKKYGIKRIECDIVPQGLHIDKKWGFRCSFYTPWSYITGARTCLLASVYHPEKSRFVTQELCSKPCKRYFIRYDTGSEALPLVQRGNSLFFNNTSLIKSFNNKKRVFDRVILENLLL